MVYSGRYNCNLFVERFVVGMFDNAGAGDAGSLVNESFEGLLVSSLRHIEEEDSDGLALLLVVLLVAY